MRVRLGFWLWGVRCALKPQWQPRPILWSDIAVRVKPHLIPIILREVYGQSLIVKHLERKP